VKRVEARGVMKEGSSLACLAVALGDNERREEVR